MPRRCPAGMVRQSILFPKKKYTKDQARAWCKKHKLKSRIFGGKKGARYWRAPQVAPSKLHGLKTITLGKGVKAIIGFAGKKKKSKVVGKKRKYPRAGATKSRRKPTTKRKPKKAVKKTTKKKRRRVAANKGGNGSPVVYMVQEITGTKKRYYATTEHSPFPRKTRMKTKKVADPNTVISYVNKRSALAKKKVKWIRSRVRKIKGSKSSAYTWESAPHHWGMGTE